VLHDELQCQLPQLLPRLWRFALRLTRDPAAAQDLVQRSCLRAIEHRSQRRPGSATLNWLFAVMLNSWLNEVDERQRCRESRLEHELAAPMLPAHRDDLSRTVLLGEIVDAVQLLPDEQRLVMLLVAVEGLSHAEAAEVLDVPIDTVMSRLSHARSMLGQWLLGSQVPARRVKAVGNEHQ
jgi:RNA polymerase sigma-70 factor (ECF subfamily)